jgi:hypothetical protein
MGGWLNRELLPVLNRSLIVGLLAYLHGEYPKEFEKCSPESDVAADAARRDNTGVGGIATLSTAAGFFLVIMVDAEPSLLLCAVVWSTFK